jgi:pSer/pThr/pTyr-binding forkhead associated (FHA) protein
MKVRLIERGETPEQMREIPITDTEFLIGRGADCDLRLWVSSISRHHCLIRIEKDAVVLTDLGSANGTFVNGNRVRSQTALQSGDWISLGTRNFVLETSDHEGPWPSAPAPTTVKLPFATGTGLQQGEPPGPAQKFPQNTNPAP